MLDSAQILGVSLWNEQQNDLDTWLTAAGVPGADPAGLSPALLPANGKHWFEKAWSESTTAQVFAPRRSQTGMSLADIRALMGTQTADMWHEDNPQGGLAKLLFSSCCHIGPRDTVSASLMSLEAGWQKAMAFLAERPYVIFTIYDDRPASETGFAFVAMLILGRPPRPAEKEAPADFARRWEAGPIVALETFERGACRADVPEQTPPMLDWVLWLIGQRRPDFVRPDGDTVWVWAKNAPLSARDTVGQD